MSLNAASVEIAGAMKTAHAAWDETRAVWVDGVAKDFEERFWEPLDAQTRAAVGAIDRLAALLAQVRRDCT